LLLAVAAPAQAQDATPAAKPSEKSTDKTTLPPVNVEGSVLSEERPVGKYAQPEWTTERRFAATRTYVLPEGMFEMEQWWRGTFTRHEGDEHRFLTEIEAGLPGRWQLDFYGHFEGGSNISTKFIGEQIEARYALANWGRIPTNPTLYLEYENNHIGPHVLEGKLLLADEYRKGWHWGANLSYEQELGGGHAIERAITLAASKTIKDSRFAVGVEAVMEYVTEHGGDDERNLMIGPSLQWRPTKTVHLDFVPLFGLSHDAPHSQIYIVLGVNLRQGEKGHDAEPPVSSRR
jgi:hypothetical protein